MSRFVSAAPRCEWLRHVLSIVLCARLTVSEHAPLRRSDRSLGRSSPGPIHMKIPPMGTNGSGNGTAHKVRDRLCQIIRQHKLDPELVKAYAVDFCGTKALKDATREQVERFVQRLAESARKDRDALLCQLNSYARPNQEVVA